MTTLTTSSIHHHADYHKPWLRLPCRRTITTTTISTTIAPRPLLFAEGLFGEELPISIFAANAHLRVIKVLPLLLRVLPWFWPWPWLCLRLCSHALCLYWSFFCVLLLSGRWCLSSQYIGFIVLLLNRPETYPQTPCTIRSLHDPKSLSNNSLLMWCKRLRQKHDALRRVRGRERNANDVRPNAACEPRA